MKHEDISRNILSSTATIEDAMRQLNEGIGGVVLCVNESGAMCGLLTDGDIRRALLGGATMSSALGLHMNTNYRFATTDMNHAEHLKMLSATVRHVPVLENGKPVGLVTWGAMWRLPVAEPLLGGNEMKYLIDCIDTVWISSQGEYIDRFQAAFSAYHDGALALSTSSGTTALHLALEALDIGPGDEVIVPNTTFGASANVVIHAGATPVFVDIEPEYWTMDVGKMEQAITPRTKAVMPVHLYGHPCDMDAVMAVARKHGLKVIEDCAESLGAEYKGVRTGLFGDVGCYSFFANKVITTGEGGMIICRDKALMDRMSMLRDHGMTRQRRYWHLEAGFNYRMTNLQAALGLAQMERIEHFLAQRRKLVGRYNQRLAGLPGIRRPRTAPWARNIHWLYSIEVDSSDGGFTRDYLTEALRHSGVETRPVFPPLHVQPAYGSALPGLFPVSERFGDQGLSLPTSNAMSVESADLVCDAIHEIVTSSKNKAA